MDRPQSGAPPEAGQAEVIAFLSRPESYTPRPETVERLETHISHVFLAGDKAYKLKKAVRLPFLDFSTLERRGLACRNELRVNRRSAPHIYEAVAPVTRKDGGFEIGGEGEPVDWLVRMRRFAQDALYDRMARDGRLTAEHMEPLAAAVSALHGIAGRVLDRDRPVKALARIVRENGETLAGRPDFKPADADGLTRASLEHLERLGPLLRARATGGCVRHCHGDLHLRNIVEIDGRPVLFDAIEFDDDMATVDVLYDLAFLLMDLWRRGLKVHANRLFNTYLERDAGTAHLPGLAALPLFLSVRAAIRSKVEALRQDGEGEAWRSALDYLALAREFLAPPGPMLVAIGGLSGTGKTTVARGLAASVGAAPGAVILRSDVERKKLFGAAPQARLGGEAYTAAVTATVYGVMRKKAAFALAAGHSVIADAVHGREEERGAIEQVAVEGGIPFKGLWLEAPEAALVSRVTGRKGDASDADADVVKQQLRRGTGEIRWARVDSGGDVETTCREAEALLASA